MPNGTRTFRRTYMAPSETRWRTTPQGRVLQFGLKDAMIIERSNKPRLSPNLFESETWRSRQPHVMKKFREFELAKKKFYKDPSLRTHNKVGQLNKQLDNMMQRVNDLYQINKTPKPSGSLYQSHRVPQYSISKIMESYQPTSRQPYQYGSTLRQLDQSLYQTRRTPQYSVANITQRYQPTSRQPYQYGSNLRQWGQSLR
jgi:hypothetical protein